MTLLDTLMPSYDVRTRHTVRVDAPAERVAQIIESFRPSQDASPITRLLFRMRGLKTTGGTLREALEAGSFTLIGKQPGRELVFGIAGRFWAVREQKALKRLSSAADFMGFNTPGAAVAALSIGVEPRQGGGTLLATETRVRCLDAAARRRFGFYWTVVGPFSGIIRRDWLRSMKRLAEAA